MKLLEIMKEDETGQFVNMLANLPNTDVEDSIDVASKYICRIYGQSEKDGVDEAHYNKLMKMTGKGIHSQVRTF